MELTEFIEKYRVSNFETYLKDDASIEYWQNLIIEFTKDKNELNNTDIFFYRELKRPNETVFGISFGNFCREQIELIEIKNKFNLIAPIVTEYNNEHLNIFSPLGFELFDKMFKEFTESKEFRIQLTSLRSEDLNFMFAVLKKNNFIHKTTGNKDFLVWLNEHYKTDFQKIGTYFLNGDFTNNNSRFRIYNEIKSNM